MTFRRSLLSVMLDVGCSSATSTILRPSSNTIATASALNSSVNDRRVLGVFCFSIVDMVTSFRR